MRNCDKPIMIGFKKNKTKTFFYLKCMFNGKIPPKVESTHCFEYFTVNSKNATTQMINTSLYFMLHNCDLSVFHREGGVNMVRFSNNSEMKAVNVRKNAKRNTENLHYRTKLSSPTRNKI